MEERLKGWTNLSSGNRTLFYAWKWKQVNQSWQRLSSNQVRRGDRSALLTEEEKGDRICISAHASIGNGRNWRRRSRLWIDWRIGLSIQPIPRRLLSMDNQAWTFFGITGARYSIPNGRYEYGDSESQIVGNCSGRCIGWELKNSRTCQRNHEYCQYESPFGSYGKLIFRSLSNY